MSLLKALRFPLRKPMRFLSFAILHTFVFWLFSEPMIYDERYDGSVPLILLLLLSLMWIVVNAILLHGALVESIRRITSGQDSLPKLSLSLLKIGGIRPFLTSLVLFVYFIAFAYGMQILPFVLDSYHFAPDGVSFGEALERFALDTIAIVLATLTSLVYFTGLARFALEGRGSIRAAIEANLSLLLKNKLTAIRYVLFQLLMLGFAALVLHVGAEIDYQIRPRELGQYPEDMRIMPWMAFSMLLALCGYLYFWNASVHLLAQFAAEIGLAPAPDAFKGKAGAT